MFGIVGCVRHFGGGWYLKVAHGTRTPSPACDALRVREATAAQVGVAGPFRCAQCRPHFRGPHCRRTRFEGRRSSAAAQQRNLKRPSTSKLVGTAAKSGGRGEDRTLDPWRPGRRQRRARLRLALRGNGAPPTLPASVTRSALAEPDCLRLPPGGALQLARSALLGGPFRRRADQGWSDGEDSARVVG